MASELNREVRKRPATVIQCPRCFREVTLWQETEEWDSQGNHLGYGPPVGDCCGLAFLDDPWRGVISFVLEES